MEGTKINDILTDSPVLPAPGGAGNAGTGAVTRRRARVKSSDISRLPDFRGTGAGGGEPGGGGGGGLSDSGTLSSGELPAGSTGTDRTNGELSTVGSSVGGGGGGASAGTSRIDRSSAGGERAGARARAGTISLGGSSDTDPAGGRSASEEAEYLGFAPVASPASPAAATGAVRKAGGKGSGAVRGKQGGSAGSSAPAMPEPSPLYQGLVVENREQMITLWLGAGFILLASVRGPHWVPDNLEERLVPIAANLGADIRNRLPALISKIEGQAPLTAALVQLGMLVAPIIAVEVSLASNRVEGS